MAVKKYLMPRMDAAAAEYMVYYVCDTEAERPTSGVQQGDLAWCKDTKNTWICDQTSPSVTWTQVNGGGAALPAGLIVMWSGLLANIPSGWKLCDGSLGTPDLRDKFVKGAAAGVNPGTTGGSTTHTHAAHSYTPAGTNSAPALTMNALAGGTRKGGTSTPSSIIENGNIPTGSVAAPTFTGNAASLTHDTVDSQPPFYAVAYIMKS